MARYQIRLGEEPLVSLLDRLARQAAAVAPGLGRARARQLVDELFRSRVTQGVVCGTTASCAQVAALWGHDDPVTGPVRPCCIEYDDPFALPNAFARSATAQLEPLSDSEERDALEERLATIFRAIVGPVLYRTDSCGTLDQCASERTDPFAR